MDYITNSDKANIYNTAALDDPESLVPSPIPKIYDYIQNPDKTENNELITGYECFPELADEQFATAHELYEIITGRTQKINSRLLYHIRQSFAPGEVDPITANRIGRELALEFTGGNHMFVVATHTDRAHIHNHILVNAVNLDCNGKFKDPLYSGRRDVARISDKICREYGLSVIEHKRGWREPYNEWEKKHGIYPENKPPSKRKRLEEIIGFCLDKNPKDFDKLLKYLEDYDCYAKRRGQNISITTPFSKKPIRLSSLSVEFGELALKERIAEMRNQQSAPPLSPKLHEVKTSYPSHSDFGFIPSLSDYESEDEIHADHDEVDFETYDDGDRDDDYSEHENDNFIAPITAPETKPEITLQSILQFNNPNKLKLIIDIQNSMKAQNSIGYKRWCEKFDLVQMSQTLIFIERHQLTFDKLRLVASKNEDLPNEIRIEIAKVETRLANISELQRHLGTLNKTKDIHKQYREANSPEQFYKDNYKAMNDNAAAKRYFRENGYGAWGEFDVPKFTDTQRQYAETSAEKNKLWARYHTIVKSNSDATNAWANVKTLLNVQDEIEIAPKITPEAKRQSGPSL